MKKLMLSLMSLLCCSSAWSHGDIIGADDHPQDGIVYIDLSEITISPPASLPRSTCLVFGNNPNTLNQALTLNNQPPLPSTEGCYDRIVLMTPGTFRMQSPIVIGGTPRKRVFPEDTEFLTGFWLTGRDPEDLELLGVTLDFSAIETCPILIRGNPQASLDGIHLILRDPATTFCDADSHEAIPISLMGPSDFDDKLHIYDSVTWERSVAPTIINETREEPTETTAEDPPSPLPQNPDASTRLDPAPTPNTPSNSNKTPVTDAVDTTSTPHDHSTHTHDSPSTSSTETRTSSDTTQPFTPYYSLSDLISGGNGGCSLIP